MRTHERPDRLPREDGFDPFDIDNTHVTPEAVLTVADPAAPAAGARPQEPGCSAALSL